MEYFSAFPKIDYNGYTITDISKRVNFIQRIKDNATLYQYHILQDGQRPEDIALQYYNDVKLFWIVCFVNDIVDPFYDWLLTEPQLFIYVSAKYGAENVYTVHHYEAIDGSDLPLGTWVDFGTPFSESITNLAYEISLNEAKRNIKILRPVYVQQVISEFISELGQ